MECLYGKKTVTTDYLYATARIRAVEAADSLHEKIDKMLNAADFSEAVYVLSGSSAAENINSGNYQTVLDSELVKSYELVGSMLGLSPILTVLKCPYDCNNLKLAIKSEIKGVKSTDLYYTFGTVSVAELENALRERDFSAFPNNMACAAVEALEAYSRTSDPQAIDIAVDRACLTDMLEISEGFGCKYLTDIVKNKVDSYNILGFIRCTRMKKSADFYRKLSLDGGTIASEKLIAAYENGLEALADLLKGSWYSSVSDTIEKHLAEPMQGFFSNIERRLENVSTSRIEEVKFISFGPEIPVSFLINRERELKNAGIILAGKSAGLEPEVIRERLRV